MIPHAPLLAIIIPIISAVALYVFGRRVEKHAGWLATIAVSLSVFMILSMVTDLIERGSIHFTYAWIRTPSLKLTFGFWVDMISFPVGLIVAVVSALSCFYSIKYMKGKSGQRGYYANLLLFMAGMIGVILSANLLQFYFFWELMLVPSYFLIAFWGTSKKRLAIGFKYFIFTHFGSLCMLLGILSIYVFTGTFDLAALPYAAVNIPPSSILPVFVLLLIGFCVKMALFPVHTWLPDAHAEAPAPISAMLSGAMIKCGAYAIARILLSGFGQTMVQTSDVLMALGVITMIYGGLLALAQTDIKRLLAYSSISQMGYIFFGLATWLPDATLGATGGLFHVINHAICKALLFMCAGAIIHQTGTRNIKKLGGLAGKMPITCIASLIGALSLAGIPPLNGFWSEWMIFSGGISSGKIFITTIAVFSTVITLGYYLWFVWRVFFGTTPKELENTKEASWLLYIPIVVLSAIAFVLGIWPDIILRLIALG
ncbi:MAG: NADH-quinone oxidoreductase subunit M [Candidatus Bathyarchaeota archaeon]|nr:NADH-quinone oxidoreductase subunit M [Candidatus Bathyarchaeota archaeon]